MNAMSPRRSLPTSAELLALPGIKALIEPDPVSRVRASDCSCEWEGRRFEARSAHGASNALCRELVAVGCPDQALHVFDATGAYRFTQRSIHEAAKWTYAESASEPLRMKPYKESPFAAGAIEAKTAVELRGVLVEGSEPAPVLDSAASVGEAA